MPKPKKATVFDFDKKADAASEFDDAKDVEFSAVSVVSYAIEKFEKEHSLLFGDPSDAEKKAVGNYEEFFLELKKVRASKKGEDEKDFPGWSGVNRRKYLGAIQIVNKFILESLGSKKADFSIFKVQGLAKWLSIWSFYIWRARIPFTQELDADDTEVNDMHILEDFLLLIVSNCRKDTYSVDALFDGRSINGGLFPNGWSQFGTVDGSKEETDYPDMSGLRLILFTIYLASMPLDEVGESRIRKACIYYNGRGYKTLMRHFGCLLVAWAPEEMSTVVELQNISNVQLPGKQDSTLYFLNTTMHFQKNHHRPNPPNATRLPGFHNLAVLVVHRMFVNQMNCKSLSGVDKSAKAKFLRYRHNAFSEGDSAMEKQLGFDYALRNWVKLCRGEVKTERGQRGKPSHTKVIKGLEERVTSLQENVSKLGESFSRMEQMMRSIMPTHYIRGQNEQGEESWLPWSRRHSFNQLGSAQALVGADNLAHDFGTPKGSMKQPPNANISQRKAPPSLSNKQPPSSTKKAAHQKLPPEESSMDDDDDELKTKSAKMVSQRKVATSSTKKIDSSSTKKRKHSMTKKAAHGAAVARKHSKEKSSESEEDDDDSQPRTKRPKTTTTSRFVKTSSKNDESDDDDSMQQKPRAKPSKEVVSPGRKKKQMDSISGPSSTQKHAPSSTKKAAPAAGGGRKPLKEKDSVSKDDDDDSQPRNRPKATRKKRVVKSFSESDDDAIQPKSAAKSSKKVEPPGTRKGTFENMSVPRKAPKTAAKTGKVVQPTARNQKAAPTNAQHKDDEAKAAKADPKGKKIVEQLRREAAAKYPNKRKGSGKVISDDDEEESDDDGHDPEEQDDAQSISSNKAHASDVASKLDKISDDEKARRNGLAAKAVLEGKKQAEERRRKAAAKNQNKGKRSGTVMSDDDEEESDDDGHDPEEQDDAQSISSNKVQAADVASAQSKSFKKQKVDEANKGGMDDDSVAPKDGAGKSQKQNDDQVSSGKAGDDAEQEGHGEEKTKPSSEPNASDQEDEEAENDANDGVASGDDEVGSGLEVESEE